MPCPGEEWAGAVNIERHVFLHLSLVAGVDDVTVEESNLIHRRDHAPIAK